jgi:chromosome segregation ATPase
VGVLQKRLNAEALRFEQLSNEFENHKQNASLSTTAEVDALNAEIEQILSAHNEYVNRLNIKIEGLELEVETLTEVFESTTNALSATENLLDGKIEELAVATQVSETLNLQYTTLQTLLSTKDNEFEAEKISLQNSFKSELENKELEFQKLLAENSNLINEIDLAQDNIEAKEAEISILNVEFNDLKSQSIGKSEYFKETLSTKNFEITNLEANNAALTEEISQLKLEIKNIKEQHAVDSLSSDAINQLKATVSILSDEKNKALNEIDQTQTVIGELNASLEVLNEKLRAYEVEIASLKLTGNSEAQDAFIDRLFKQIDALNDQRLELLDEKEQMAGQLLKMNKVIGHISQQVDSEQIDVTSLNNHRKNVILAKNSSESDDGFHMKEQINDLVREIDKCIALLST